VFSILGEACTAEEKKGVRRLDAIYERQDKLMKNVDKLVKEWLVLRKEQEQILKKLGWW